VRGAPGARLASVAATAWKNATSSRMRSASSCGTASAKAFDSARTAWSNRSLPFSCARMWSWVAGNSASRSGRMFNVMVSF